MGRFLIRRGLKIYPAYFVFIMYLIAMPTAKVLARGGDIGATVTDLWGQYWPNLLFLQNYVGTNPAGHTWTLAVEEHFYLTLPFALVALAAMSRLQWLPLTCLVIVPVTLLALRGLSVWTGDAYAAKMSATHLRLDALLFGVGIRAATYYLPAQFAALKSWRRSLFIAGLLLWLPNLVLDPGLPVMKTLGLTCTFLGAGAFLIAAYHTRSSDFSYSRRLVVPLAKLIGWIGFYSYAIYLWHVTAMGILGREVGDRLLGSALPPGQLAWLVAVLIISAGAVGSGVVAANVVEWPVLRVRDRFFPSKSGSAFVDRDAVPGRVDGSAPAPSQTATAV